MPRPNLSRFRAALLAIGSLALAFALVLGVAHRSRALSVHDVVRLLQEEYAEEAIIELIRVTESRFDLDAEAILELKAAGSSDGLIRTMAEAPGSPVSLPPLSAPPTESSEAPAGEAARPPDQPVTMERAQVHRQPSAAPPSALPPVSGRPPAEVEAREPAQRFAAYPFEEPGAGHGGGHQHYAVAVSGVRTLILRSEAGHRTMQERAAGITAELNRAVRAPEGRFFASQAPEPTVWYRPGPADPPVRILRVDPGDVVAYQSRSLGEVSSERLAAYWAALLNDYTALFLFRRPPRDLAGLHFGETLERLYEELSSASKSDEPGMAQASTLALLDHLAADDKEHLLELAVRVPAEFGR